MTAIENIALVLVVVSALKIFFLLVKPSAWFNTVGKLWMKPGIATVVSLILGAIVLRYLLVELTIVQIFAVFAFTAMFFWFSLAPYRKDFYDLAVRDISVGGIWKKNWPATLIWIILMIWVIKEIFD
ncbi:MAG: hypothetical protein A3H60_02435 [Candidatus Zambryskibacteria bacterium RIFCSPLOWO2_02_FULL_44_12b]|uniref:Uncharacterized protein n=1 Tax=Candidatus Zambryskibacteria bacterium RIFCSPLOWO2_02_FULL_44_12b TaxID=1802772 RepID=A0A1G2UJX3_9BACT|nr:MAG: hypothetical protein A3H60_02435 [Candidatus Zambryskibacteria bacterium RIFCSPLOWO2_02_FULL_44_12b]